MAKIELSNVTKQFPDGTVAVSATSFVINDGEFFILVGPSGCGKSTLLHMIVGLEEVSSGEIRLDGKIINHLDPKDRNMAMVFQSYALYPHMNVRQNIAFPLVMAKVPKEEISKRVEETAAVLELSHLLDSKPRNLSGGSVSVLRWAGRLCAIHKLFYLMSHCPILMPGCAIKCVPSSLDCKGG